MPEFDFDALARANPPAASCRAQIREQAADFQVDEQIPFEPSGQGGHAMLLIEKTGTNTDWLAKQLARFAGVNDVAVGYAGIKDRHAVTSQWFTINLEGHSEPDWEQFEADHCRILQRSYHNKKLKRGVLSGNRFCLRLTRLQGESELWQQNLEWIQQHGVPNYFAEQRFGHEFANLEKAQQWFEFGKKPKQRQQRSMILSAARSWLFNLVVSERVKQGSWQQWLAGDVMQLNGSSSVFVPDADDDSIAPRLDALDIHPTAPLWGRGTAMTQSDSLALEKATLADWPVWRDKLEQLGLKQERRPIRVYPRQMTWQWHNHSLTLSFFLPAGSYATAVLRELAIINDMSQRNSAHHAFSQ